MELSSYIAKTVVDLLLTTEKTGEYLIFKKYNNENYYLCIGIHGEDEEILNLVKSTYVEFPFLETSIQKPNRKTPTTSF